jgi:AraC-like DNA-binding protein
VVLPAEAVRVHLVGVFARGASEEPVGANGAKLQFLANGRVQGELPLVNGRHYADAVGPLRDGCLFGDGSSLDSMGMLAGTDCQERVDVLSVDVPSDCAIETLRFQVSSRAARFVVFDVMAEATPAHGCPFHQRGGGVSLNDVASAVRLGDRVKFQRAIDQLGQGMRSAEDLDEARGQALTFLAVVTSAMLELGGGRELHRVQLDAARAMDQLSLLDDVVVAADEWVSRIAAPMFAPVESPSAYLVDRALAIVDRNFAKEITDDMVAAQLGLSTSHFRFLFKQATGQPFHKYLMGLRLEKAKSMLVEDEAAVSEVARAVGFTGLAHFSRAFTQRFQASPTNFRRGAQ